VVSVCRKRVSAIRRRVNYGCRFPRFGASFIIVGST